MAFLHLQWRQGEKIGLQRSSTSLQKWILSTIGPMSFKDNRYETIDACEKIDFTSRFDPGVTCLYYPNKLLLALKGFVLTKDLFKPCCTS